MFDDEKEYLFSEEQIKGRFLDLGEIVQNFLDDFEEEAESKLSVDWSRLYVATVSAYDDVARFKAYHLEDPRADLSDAIKRCAFLTKWLIREMPLSFPSERGTTFGGHVLANEALAIRVSMANLSVFCGQDIEFTEQKLWEFIYDLKYREFTSDSLIAIYQMIAEMADGVLPIEQ